MNRPSPMMKTIQQYDDDAQIAALNAWKARKHSSHAAGYIICIIVALTLVAGITHYIKTPPPLTLSIGCRECHVMPPVLLPNLKRYKEAHHHPTAEQARILSELAK